MRAYLCILMCAGCGGTDIADFSFGGGGGGGGGGDFGATPGGVKDLRLARELVAAGQVPPSDAVLVEAMYAEHDLGLDGAACSTTLCLRGAGAFAPELDGTPRGWAQIGLSSTIDPTTWAPPSTTYVFVIDVSGSMGWGWIDDAHPPASQLARKTLHALTDRLRDEDRVALVTFGETATTALSLHTGAERDAVHTAIDSLATGGSTNMEAGMDLGYAIGHDALGQTEQVRVIVFTDTQPNVGATSASDFETKVAAADDAGIATTVLDFGLGIGPEVMRGMASLRGANAFGMIRLDDVDDFIANDYPWFTTPIAYDLHIDATISSGWSIQRGLGFPAATDAQTQLAVSTVFLSKRKGALLVALQGGDTPDGCGGTLHLSYTDPGGSAVASDVQFGYPHGGLDANGTWFSQHGIARTTALGIYTEAMHAALVAYGVSDAETAETQLAAALDRFTSDASIIGDADLPDEVAFGAAMLQLVHDRAPQGTLYGPH